MTSVESRQEPSYRPFLILNGRDKLVFVTAQQTRKLLRFIWVCGDWVRFSLVMSGTRTLSKACWTSQRRKKSQAQLSVIQPKTKWKKWPSNAHKWMLGAKKYLWNLIRMSSLKSNQILLIFGPANVMRSFTPKQRLPRFSLHFLRF